MRAEVPTRDQWATLYEATSPINPERFAIRQNKFTVGQTRGRWVGFMSWAATFQLSGTKREIAPMIGGARAEREEDVATPLLRGRAGDFGQAIAIK